MDLPALPPLGSEAVTSRTLSEAEFNRIERLKPDAYGYQVNEHTLKRMRRHPLCPCPVPCQMRFRCTSRRHKGNRSTPWCQGADPGESCDTCWSLAGVVIAPATPSAAIRIKFT